MAYLDAKWWDAFETAARGLTRAVRTTFENDPEAAAALRRLVTGEGVESKADGNGRVDGVAKAAEATKPNGTAAKPRPAGPVVDSQLRIGDGPPLSLKAYDDGESLPKPAFVPQGIKGPRVIAIEEPEDESAGMTLERLAEHCRLKERAAQWQAERSRRLDAGERSEELRAEDDAVLNEGKRLGVFLWTVNPSFWRDRGPRAFKVVAGVYGNLAGAAEAMALADAAGRPEDQERALNLLAAAQSATRAMVVAESTRDRDDDDQEWAFGWLKEQTSLREVFVRHHMKLDEPADPADYPDLAADLAELRGRIEQRDKVRKQRENLYGKVAYTIKKMPTGDGDDARLAADNPSVSSLAGAVDKLLEDGVPASDRRLRDMLVPVVGRLPEEVPEKLGRVLAEVDAHLDRLAAEEREAEEAGDDNSDELVTRARELTEGRSAVLIGGQPEEEHRRRLERDLGLSELKWLRVAHGESFEQAAGPALREPGVSLVLIMTRWRSHRDGPEARRACKERGITLVELPGGYGTRRVAHELLRQASDKLAAA